MQPSAATSAVGSYRAAAQDRVAIVPAPIIAGVQEGHRRHRRKQHRRIIWVGRRWRHRSQLRRISDAGRGHGSGATVTTAPCKPPLHEVRTIRVFKPLVRRGGIVVGLGCRGTGRDSRQRRRWKAIRRRPGQDICVGRAAGVVRAPLAADVLAPWDGVRIAGAAGAAGPRRFFARQQVVPRVRGATVHAPLGRRGRQSVMCSWWRGRLQRWRGGRGMA